MRKKVAITLGALVIVAFVFSTPKYASACSKCPSGALSNESYSGLDGKFFKKYWVIKSNKEALELSDDQYATIKDIKADVAKTIIRHDAEIQIALIDVKSSLHGWPVDLDAVNEHLETKYHAKLAKAKAVAAGIAELKGTLDEDQYAKLKDLYKQGGSAVVCSKALKQ